MPEFNLSDYMKMKNEYDNQDALFGMTTNKGLADIGAGVQYLGLAEKLGSNLFGSAAKTNKLNRSIMKENLGMLQDQRAANQEMLANKRKFNDTWAGASNGLASRATGSYV